jgi:uncharacterized protein (TIGR03067 family)
MSAFRHFLVPVVAAAALLAWSGHRPERAAADAKSDGKLEGTWSLWRSIKSGDTTADSGEGILIDGTTLQFTLRGKNLAEKGTLSIRADADPKEIDVEYTVGRYKGKKQLGIYRFTAPGQLEIAWGEPGSDKRPKLFTGKLTVGAGAPLAIYRSSDFKLPEAAVKELKALEGKWKVTEYHRFGRAEPDAQKRGEGFLIEGEDMQYFWGGNNKGGKAQFSVDPTKDPKQIEIVYTVGQDRYKTRIGIYKLSGKKLEISLSAINSDTRPTAFTGIKGTTGAGDQYLVYEKE